MKQLYLKNLLDCINYQIDIHKRIIKDYKDDRRGSRTDLFYHNLQIDFYRDLKEELKNDYDRGYLSSKHNYYE